MVDARRARRNALLVLLLTVPVSTIGVVISTVLAPGSIGYPLVTSL